MASQPELGYALGGTVGALLMIVILLLLRGYI